MKGRIIVVVFVLLIAANLVSSQDYLTEMSDLIVALKTVAAALAVLLISIQGLKYITAESPNDRAEAKKGLIWIIVGLVVAAVSANLVCGLYCMAIAQYWTGSSTPLNCQITSGICTIT
ncbi:MAG: pilin [Methanobacteriota archaeon]